MRDMAKNRKLRPKVDHSDKPLASRVREMGFKLGRAELYGSTNDLSAMKRAHDSLLRELYKRGGK